jgi:alkylation response protein AidB-like acyl-CoA dehydrogenase
MRTYRGLAVSEEHRELAASARAVLADRNAIGAARSAADGAPSELPAFWKDAVDLGWLGLHIPEQDGGHGFGLPELALDGDPAVQYALLFSRGLTIAGGTSEIIRTQVAERVVGLPRD